jgi:glycosyltransferase involved in cell wall biosynthesis
MVLTFLVCLLKCVFKYRLIVDRHSNFKLNILNKKKIKWRIFYKISRYTIQKSDITIVTNKYLRDLVDACGGSGFILQDKIPSIINVNRMILQGEINIVYINTYSEDEPYNEVIQAARYLPATWNIYVTGKLKKGIKVPIIPKNVILTDYLSENDYYSLIANCDIVIVLTNQEYTLNCGAYEALALEKPIILSNTKTISSYFFEGPYFVNNSSKEIEKAINLIITNYDHYKNSIINLKKILIQDWNKKFNILRAVITTIAKCD